MILDLHPSMQGLAFDLRTTALEHKLDLLIYCTQRSLKEQAVLYRNGRTLAVICTT